MTGRRSLVLADQAVVSATNFLTTVLLVRQLGIGTFGVFSLIWLLVLLAVGMQQALISQPMLTIAPKREGHERTSYLGAALVLQGAFSLVCAAAVAAAYGVVLATWQAPALTGTLPAVVAVVTAKQAHAFVRSSAYVRGRRLAALGNDLVAYGGQLAFLTLLWRTDRLDLVSTLWAVAGCSGLATILALPGLPERRTTRGVLVASTRRHWRFGRWLGAVQLARFFGSNSYLIAAGALLGAGSVGAIKAAQSVIGVLHVLFLAMENVVPVTAARLYVQDGIAGLVRYVRRLGIRGLAATAAVSGAIGLAPRRVLEPLYGDAVTADLILALRALALLYLFAFVIALLQIAFRTLERTRPIFLAYAVNTLVAMTCARPVVAAYGLEGAVFGMLAQQALMATLLGVTFTVLVRNATASQRASGIRPSPSLPAR